MWTDAFNGEKDTQNVKRESPLIDSDHTWGWYTAHEISVANFPPHALWVCLCKYLFFIFYFFWFRDSFLASSKGSLWFSFSFSLSIFRSPYPENKFTERFPNLPADFSLQILLPTNNFGTVPLFIFIFMSITFIHFWCKTAYELQKRRGTKTNHKLDRFRETLCRLFFHSIIINNCFSPKTNNLIKYAENRNPNWFDRKGNRIN